MDYQENPYYHGHPMIHSYYIVGEIGEPELYLDLYTLLRTATNNDVINLYINSVGGLLSTTCQIINAINDSCAEVITYADGDCASAGSLLLFSGHKIVINEHCQVLMHDSSGGVGDGKANEMAKSAAANAEQTKRLYHSVYGKYFTKAQVNKILAGHDKYLLSDELKKIIGGNIGE